MEAFTSLIGTPLGYIMYWCFELLRNYGAAILLFTLLTKVILFPLSLVAQKNSIKMVKMQPELADIRQRNGGNGELIMQETRALYKKERYSTVTGILPLLIQIPIILGLIDVIYNPLKHLLHLSAQTVSSLTTRTAELLGVSADSLGYSAQLHVLEAVQANPSIFLSLPQGAPSGQDMADIVARICSVDALFFGIDLAAVPHFGNINIIIPVLSGLSALALCLVQNRYNVLQAEAGFVSKWGMTIFLVAFSGYFAYALPCGLGLYWTAGNLLSIPVLALCNLIYSPRKYIDYARRVLPARLSRAQRAEIRIKARALAKRERTDSKRFYSKGLKKNLVVYSEGSGFWKYYAAILSYVTAHSDTVVHYVTNDPDDRIFQSTDPQIVPYYIGSKALIAFMMKMDADIVLMTTPDLEAFHIKRSLVRKDVEYIYLDHGLGSFHLMLRKGSLDHFDTIFVYCPNHIEEVRGTEKLYGLPHKTLVKTGFGLLDELLERVRAMCLDQSDVAGEVDIASGSDVVDYADSSSEISLAATSALAQAPRQILIAPSWQTDNLLDLCIDEVLESLLGRGYRIIVRPHPEYFKRFPTRMEALISRYTEACAKPDEKGGTLTFETDFSSNETVYHSDLVITDWSTIAQEFSFSTKKPSLFINTPMKILNPEHDLLGIEALEISLRNKLGVSLDTDKLDGLADAAANLISRSDEYRSTITMLLEQTVFDIGDGARGGGDYLIARIKEIEFIRSLGEDPAKHAKPALLKAADERLRLEKAARRSARRPLREQT